MGAPVLCVIVAALFVFPGCTKVVHYAVLAPHEAMDEEGSCFRQCQMMHASRTKQFLGCVETCPDSRVVKERTCKEVDYDDDEYGCTTAHNKRFDGAATAGAIGIGVLVEVLLAILVLSAGNQSR